MKILLAMDNSLGSVDAPTELEERLWEPGTMVRVLHVVEKFVPPAAELWYDAGGDIDQTHKDILVRRRRMVEWVRKTATLRA